MDSIRQENLKKLVRRLDASASPAASPRDAERIMGEILEPLLSEDGYIVQPVGLRSDAGMDFIAQKDPSALSDADDIAIVYKHYRQSAVGVEVVRNVLGAAYIKGLSRAMIVTN